MLKNYTYPSGKQSSRGYFKNNKPIGYWTNWFESGQISSYGKWNSNGLDSTWLFYSEKGEIKRSITYANNLKNGQYLVYDSIQIIEFNGFYINDTLQGPYKRFKAGKLVEEGNYDKGEINNFLKEYDQNTGNLITIKSITDGKISDEQRINRSINGKKEGIWQTFDNNGKLLSQEIYENGQLIYDQVVQSIPFDFEEEFHTNGKLKSRYDTFISCYALNEANFAVKTTKFRRNEFT